MYTRGSYTVAKRASSGNSTDLIKLDDAKNGFDGIIITSTLTGVVTAYMITESSVTDTATPYTTGLEFPASTAPGTYNIHVGAIKCATAADATKIIAFR